MPTSAATLRPPPSPGRRRRISRQPPHARGSKESQQTSRAPYRRSHSSKDVKASSSSKFESFSSSFSPPNFETKIVKKPAERKQSNARSSVVVRQPLEGERAGIRWTIVFDHPVSHNQTRMVIVRGVDVFEQEDTPRKVKARNVLPQRPPEKEPQAADATKEQKRKGRDTRIADVIDRKNAGNRNKGERKSAAVSAHPRDVLHNSFETLPSRNSQNGKVTRKKNFSDNHATPEAPRHVRRKSSSDNLPDVDTEKGVRRRGSSGNLPEKNSVKGKQRKGPSDNLPELESTAARRRSPVDRSKRDSEASKGHALTRQKSVDDINPKLVQSIGYNNGKGKIATHPRRQKSADSVNMMRINDMFASDDKSDESSDDENDDDGSVANTVVGPSDEQSIDPMAGFLPRAISESIHRRSPQNAKSAGGDTHTADQSGDDGHKRSAHRFSESMENSGLEVRPSRRSRRRQPNGKKPNVRETKSGNFRKTGTSGDSSFDADGLKKLASIRSLSSNSESTSSHDPSKVSAEFMQFSLCEKGYVQKLCEDKEIRSSHTRRLAQAVAESHIPMNRVEEEDEVNFPDGSNEEYTSDLVGRGQRLVKRQQTRINQIGRTISSSLEKLPRPAIPRSRSNDGLEAMRSDPRRGKRNFLQAAHASLMRSSGDEMVALPDDMGSTHCEGEGCS